MCTWKNVEDAVREVRCSSYRVAEEAASPIPEPGAHQRARTEADAAEEHALAVIRKWGDGKGTPAPVCAECERPNCDADATVVCPEADRKARPEEVGGALDLRLGKLYRDAVRAGHTPANAAVVQVIDWCFANGVTTLGDVSMKLIDALRVTSDAQFQAAVKEKREEQILEIRSDGSTLVGRVISPMEVDRSQLRVTPEEVEVLKRQVVELRGGGR